MKLKVSSYNNIVPACFAETILLSTLGYNCKKNHQSGDNKAIESMEKKATALKIIALMDKPEGISPSNIGSNYKDFRTGSYNLILKKNPKKNHYIIYINQVMEDWIYDLAKRAGINTYSSIKKLKYDLKPSSALTNKKIIKYFNDIYNKNPEPFNIINNWINELNK